VTDGTQPTCTTGTLLAGSTVPVTQSVTYEAIACKPGYLPSPVTTAKYTVAP
jgi:hypothetical protein